MKGCDEAKRRIEKVETWSLNWSWMAAETPRGCSRLRLIVLPCSAGKNKTRVPRPTDANLVRCMWLFLHKYLADGTLSRYKARLLANGCTQLEGVDVDETFSPVVKLGAIGTVISLVASRHWPIHQLDVKNAFLHGDLSETVYMHQPLGLQLFSSSTINLVAYLDVDWAGCPTTRCSTLSYCVFLGNNLLSCSSKRQLMLSRSCAEAEYRGVANAIAETCWL
ncbi:ribonuclease H-like domain-containing protein [Tanacetum coccineum]